MRIITLLYITFVICASCNKSEYLAAKPDQALIIPETLDELQAILDNVNVMNGTGQGVVPVLGEVGADNYYVHRFSTSASARIYPLLYAWNHQLNTPNTTRLVDWDLAYRSVFYSNIVLEGLTKFSASSQNDPVIVNNIKGSALFYRGHILYHLAQIFATQYDKSSAANELGLPLKMEADVNEKPSRATLQQTYDQLLDDLKRSAMLLPQTSEIKTKPSRSAAYALLSRVYQTMQDYDSSLYYSNKSLEIFNTLIDYNDNTIVDTSGSLGIRSRFNPEVIFHAKLINQTISSFMYSSSFVRVDSVLYDSYSANDLRKVVFFSKASPGRNYKGSYDASTALFGGIAADEVYLIRAESYARKGMVAEAMNDLNTLMSKRWRAGTFVPFEAANAQEALEIILRERRKELIFRGLRWIDLRRLNHEGANILINRIIDGQTYTLLPNDKRYTWLIPYDVMSFNPDWKQNAR